MLHNHHLNVDQKPYAPYPGVRFFRLCDMEILNPCAQITVREYDVMLYYKIAYILLLHPTLNRKMKNNNS